VDISVGEIADLVLDVLGKPPELREHVPERPGQVDRHIGSTDKAERLLGWRARTSFADGLERTVAWYRDNEAWWRGIRSRTHTAWGCRIRSRRRPGCSRPRSSGSASGSTRPASRSPGGRPCPRRSTS